MQMVEHLFRSQIKPPVDAYLLCSICADLVIYELVEGPVHGVSLHSRDGCSIRNTVTSANKALLLGAKIP
jgi:hypothetical protein